MLKAIVTVMDENDRILQDKKLIFETDSTPVGLGTRHEFNFAVVTANEEVTNKITRRADEIREAWENDMDIDDGGTE